VLPVDLLGPLAHLLPVEAEPVQRPRRRAVVLGDQAEQEVPRAPVSGAVPPGLSPGNADRFTGGDGEGGESGGPGVDAGGVPAPRAEGGQLSADDPPGAGLQSWHGCLRCRYFPRVYSSCILLVGYVPFAGVPPTLQGLLGLAIGAKIAERWRERAEQVAGIALILLGAYLIIQQLAR
jgi:hypothetical protein